MVCNANRFQLSVTLSYLSSFAKFSPFTYFDWTFVHSTEKNSEKDFFLFRIVFFSYKSLINTQQNNDSSFFVLKLTSCLFTLSLQQGCKYKPLFAELYHFVLEQISLSFLTNFSLLFRNFIFFTAILVSAAFLHKFNHFGFLSFSDSLCRIIYVS